MDSVEVDYTSSAARGLTIAAATVINFRWLNCTIITKVLAIFIPSFSMGPSNSAAPSCQTNSA